MAALGALTAAMVRLAVMSAAIAVSGCAAEDDGSGSGSWEVVMEEEPEDCAGSWSPCDEACEKVFVVSRAAAGTGAECPGPAPCDPGDGLCPQPPTVQSHARAFGVTMRVPRLHGCRDCEHCVDNVPRSATSTGISAVCADEFISELARTMEVSQRRLSVLSVLPSDRADALLFLCQLTDRSSDGGAVNGEASTLESLRSLEHMVETPEISIYLLGRIILDVEVMDGSPTSTPMPPPPPPPPPDRTPRGDGNAVSSTDGGGGGGRGEDDTFQVELEKEHARLQEVVVIIFGVLSGVALLVFALAELPKDELPKYAPVDGDGIGDGIGDGGLGSSNGTDNIVADEANASIGPLSKKQKEPAAPSGDPAYPSASTLQHVIGAQDGLLDASFDTGSLSESDLGSMVSAVSSPIK